MLLTEMANLPSKIILCIGKPYMIMVNIDVVDGLVNGVVGNLAVLDQPQRSAICSLNMRSLAAHRHDVMHHHILMRVPVLCFSKTWGHPQEIDSYRCVTSANRCMHRASGVAIYERENECVLGAPDIEFADVCAVRNSDGIVVASVYVSTAR